jgi:predicted membrane channel-forming protein YqfA (hemolysin III family)
VNESRVARLTERTIRVAIVVAVAASVLAALLPQTPGELFSTIAYLAVVLAFLTLVVKWFLPGGTPEAKRPAPQPAIRVVYASVISVTLASMVGAALVSQPSAEGLAALAYVGLIGVAILIAIRCWLHARN